MGILQEGLRLAPFSSWGIGGPAEKAYWPETIAELSDTLSTLSLKEPVSFLGLGSNVLIADEGIKGLVVMVHKGLSQVALLEGHRVYAQAGVPCAKVSRLGTKEGYAGCVFLAGIPGTVGGALAMNAGAFGAEVWEHVLSVETVDRCGIVRERMPCEYHIGYRSVRLKTPGPFAEYFVSAVFGFRPGSAFATAAAVKQLLKKRVASQPIGTRNCGSVFRNPQGKAAGQLIESVGLKGFQTGGVRVSTKHANFIVNEGAGTAADIRRAISYIQEKVFLHKGVQLETEVRFMGF